jgi:hypothetical protein
MLQAIARHARVREHGEAAQGTLLELVLLHDQPSVNVQR